MSRGMQFVAAWFVATLVAIGVATAAVGTVRTQVTDVPTALTSAEVAALSSDATAAGVGEGATDASDGPDASPVIPSTIVTTTSTVGDGAEPSDPDTADDVTTTNSAATSDTGATTTAAPPTTTVPPASYSKTYDTEAGSVRVIVNGTSVGFGGAFPNPGWSVELKGSGPEKVVVEFKRNEGEGEITFSATLEKGELRVQIDDHHAEHDD